MTAEEKRQAVKAKYATIIGRNYYSQARRDYCFRQYSNGCYYSDCSSSISYSYKEAGCGFGILNTVGMYNCKKFTDVPVTIKGGQIQNPEVLRIGDMLLYAGTDSGRAASGYVGHVEMYVGVENGKHYLYGHGSGRPSKVEMTAKNKSRYNSKTSTKLGNRGLIRVVRFIQDDETENTKGDNTMAENTADNTAVVKKGTWNIRNGAGTEYDVIATVAGGTTVVLVDNPDWAYIKTGNISGFISKKALEGRT